MDLYTRTAYQSSRLLTLAYSTSFSMSSYLFGRDIRPHIYAIYGMVRIGDEIVDTYEGAQATEVLDEFEQQVYQALERGYATNPVLHAFVCTARQYGIGRELIAPFFDSMRLDLQPQAYDQKLYERYIHGSAEVVGLMCLRVFVNGDEQQYQARKEGAAALGAAYQKVNFLRDIAADYAERGRMYFPGQTYAGFDEDGKAAIIADIQQDFVVAHAALRKLPRSSRVAVMTSYAYYAKLLRKLDRAPIAVLKKERLRISNAYKVALLMGVALREWCRK